MAMHFPQQRTVILLCGLAIAAAPVGAQQVERFCKRPSHNQLVCGPRLLYFSAGKQLPVSNTGEASNFGPLDGRHDAMVIDAKHLAFRKASGVAELMKFGPAIPPDWTGGTGAGAACPPVTVQIYSLDPRSGARRIFDASVLNGGGEMGDSDVEVSPDWSLITVYEYFANTAAKGWKALRLPAGPPEGWQFTRYCLTRGRYAACGTGTAAPPAHRQWRWMPYGCAPDIH